MESYILNVVKRDGRREIYDGVKIKIAVKKAWDSVYDKEEKGKEFTADEVENLTRGDMLSKSEEYVTVEDVHESVIENLSYINREAGLAYAKYYTKRKTQDEMEMDLTSRIKRLVDGDKAINNENANKDSRTFSTKRDLMAGQIAKAEGLKSLPKNVRDAHLRGDIHFHK